MDDAKKQLADKLKGSNNILVTVSRDPSVDQLASCIALTLLLNKQGKHAAAVFSGKVPSTLEFLQPEETIEKNTDSLRDFIISLDKAKADKLRYKVEDNVVRIFITPYKTSISQEDLEFTQGDFNVDVVIALGVNSQDDLDEAITAHGRILHDATVASINTKPDGDIGTINWHDQQASSLSELVTDLAKSLGDNLLDTQIATALLTGIISETDRFSNDKTSALTMSASAALLAAGANQQLVATKLEEESEPEVSLQNEGQDNQPPDQQPKNEDGALDIDHEEKAPENKEGQPAEPEKSEESDESTNSADAEPIPEEPASVDTPPQDTPPISDSGQQPAEPMSSLSPGTDIMKEPPSLGGELTANSQTERLDPVTDPMSMPSSEPPQMLSRQADTPPQAASYGPPTVPDVPAETPRTDSGFTPGMTPPPPAWVPPSAPATDAQDSTLTDLEKSVDSPHTSGSDLNEVRDEVNKALTQSTTETDTPAPIEALNAQPLGGDLHPSDNTPAPVSTDQPAAPTDTATPATPQVTDPTAPPPVPPPIPFQFGAPPQNK